MAIKKFFKDMFVVEYEEELPEQGKEDTGKQQPEHKEKPAGNSKVTSLEQSGRRRPEKGVSKAQTDTGGESENGESENTMAKGIRGPKRRQSAATSKEKEKKQTAIKGDKETTLMAATQASDTKVCLFEPRVFSETQDIADELKYERAALVNLSKVDQGPKKRIVDFLSGTAYALDGDIQKVGADIFLCTPNSVAVEGEISEEKDQTDEF
ncbi:cell division protein SepF [Salinicoccus albus]|uniref:cell division protein SepF n=1 Tax=Salinicoccus albus TaxID=418756 RepID=UPI000371CD03|nr:cell division protein SepF [Salinicoccus albus]